MVCVRTRGHHAIPVRKDGSPAINVDIHTALRNLANGVFMSAVRVPTLDAAKR